MVHAALGVELGEVFAGDVGHLRAVEDVEVVVGCVAACVAFCADGGAWFVRLGYRRRYGMRTEDNQILSDTWKSKVSGPWN